LESQSRWLWSRPAPGPRATTRSPIAVRFSGDRIDTLELMPSSKNLPVQQYDAH
jgi:hypothetical protein